MQKVEINGVEMNFLFSDEFGHHYSIGNVNVNFPVPASAFPDSDHVEFGYLTHFHSNGFWYFVEPSTGRKIPAMTTYSLPYRFQKGA